jgi:hypothetical protein
MRALAYDSIEVQSELTVVGEVEISGGDSSVIDAAKPKLISGLASPSTSKTGSKIEFCFVASDDKSVSRVVGNVHDVRTGEWVVGASNSRLIAGTEKAGTWCLDAVIPIGRSDGKYEMRALAYDSIEVQSELTVVGEVEISGSGVIPETVVSPSITSTQVQSTSVEASKQSAAETLPNDPIETNKTNSPVEDKAEQVSDQKLEYEKIIDSRISPVDPTPLPIMGVIRVEIAEGSPSATFWYKSSLIIPTYIEFC